MKTALLSSLVFLAMVPDFARAHAFLDHAEPRVGTTVGAAPATVQIWFTEKLEPAFSRIKVFDMSKKEVDRHDSKVDPADLTRMTVSVASLPPGEYEVSWDAVAVDTHHTHGTFKFRVKAP